MLNMYIKRRHWVKNEIFGPKCYPNKDLIRREGYRRGQLAQMIERTHWKFLP